MSSILFYTVNPKFWDECYFSENYENFQRTWENAKTEINLTVSVISIHFVV